MQQCRYEPGSPSVHRNRGNAGIDEMGQRPLTGLGRWTLEASARTNDRPVCACVQIVNVLASSPVTVGMAPREARQHTRLGREGGRTGSEGTVRRCRWLTGRDYVAWLRGTRWSSGLIFR
jgi:hypothetical protein